MRKSIVDFDISLVKFEEGYTNVENCTTTLYFIAPKECLSDQYPEAIHSEISVEFPTNQPEACFASVMMSPTRLTDDGGSEDYNWFDVDFDAATFESLMILARRDMK